MKIDSIFANNFLRLGLFQADLSDATIHLFAGSNEAGKSSVQEAVRFALLGETVRVSRKGDYKLMIRDGAKAGTVGITTDECQISRDVKTAESGDLGSEDGSPWIPPEHLGLVLDAQRFCSLKPGERRAVIFDVTGTRVGVQDTKRRLAARGATDEYIEGVLPMLGSGFDAAHTEAKRRAADARSQWCGHTGQSPYGSQIAETWEPPVPEDYDPDALAAAEKKLHTMQVDLEKADRRAGALRERLRAGKEQLRVQGKEIKPDPKALKEIIKKIADIEGVMPGLGQQLDSLNAEISNARELVPVTCCECGAQIRVSFEGRKFKCEAYRPLSEDEIGQLTAKAIRTGEIISKNQAALKELRVRRAALEGAASGPVKAGRVTEDGIRTIAQDLEKTESECERIRESMTLHASGMTALTAAAAKVENRQEIIDRARSLNERVKGWVVISAALAPDGIPAEILADALGPVNERLRHTALKTGWAQVTVTPNMEILADGRPYTLLSESSRWRVDAAIAEMISHLTGLRLLVLDRFDVLDLFGRAQFLRWLKDLRDDYDTVLVFGTMKKCPDKMPPGMKAWWLENGEIKEEAA